MSLVLLECAAYLVELYLHEYGGCREGAGMEFGDAVC